MSSGLAHIRHGHRPEPSNSPSGRSWPSPSSRATSRPYTRTSAAWNRFALRGSADWRRDYLPAGIISFEQDFSFAEEQLRALAEGGSSWRDDARLDQPRNGIPPRQRTGMAAVRRLPEFAPVWHISTASTVVSKEWSTTSQAGTRCSEASFSRIQPAIVPHRSRR